MTYSPILIFHILVGSISILSGAAALIYRKGAPAHRKSGLVFVGSMLAMTVSGAVIAYMKPANIAVIAAVLTFYFVITALLVVRTKPNVTSVVDVAGLVIVAAVCYASAYYGNLAANSETGFIQDIEIPAGAYYFFAMVAGLCVVSDLRYIICGGFAGSQRVARHLWRMGFAMYIATSSLFTGQPQRFPEVLQGTFVLSVPENLVVLVILYWFTKILVWPSLRRLTVMVKKL